MSKDNISYTNDQLKSADTSSSASLQSEKEEMNKKSYDIFSEDNDEYYDNLLAEESSTTDEDLFNILEDLTSEIPADLLFKDVVDKNTQENIEEKIEEPNLVSQEEQELYSDLIEPITTDSSEIMKENEDIEDEADIMSNKADENSLLGQGALSNDVPSEDIQKILGDIWGDKEEINDIEEQNSNIQDNNIENIDIQDISPEASDSNLELDGILDSIDINTDISNEDEMAAADDIFSINEFLDDNEEPVNNTSEIENSNQQQETFEDIEQNILDLIPEAEQNSNNDKKSSEDISNLEEIAEKEKEEKKPGILKRIFGNIKEERSEEEIKKLKDKVYKEAEAKEKAEKEKEEKEKAEKAAKEAKKKKDAEEKKARAADAKKAKEAKAKAAKEAKAAKKDAKLKRQQEIQELLEQIDENEGKINKIGATIIFLMFISLAVFIVIGTNIYSYNNSIKNAKEQFSFKHYDEAYNYIYGIDVRKEDQEIYNKIMTVMYVKKQLNSYYTLYDMRRYDEALDSLVKGIRRYDKFIGAAEIYEIESDLKSVRDDIFKEAKDVFHVTKKELEELASIEDQVQYSMNVSQYVSERFTPPPLPKLEDSEENPDETKTNNILAEGGK